MTTQFYSNTTKPPQTTSMQFPHLAFVRRPRSPALEESMRATMGATCECCAGAHTQCSMCIGSYQILPLISSVIITCTFPFTVDNDDLKKSTILSSVICHFIQVIRRHDINPSLTNFVRRNLTVKSYGTFAL